MSCGVGHRHSSDPVLLWLWLAAAAMIGLLAWESLYAVGAAPAPPNHLTHYYYFNMQWM